MVIICLCHFLREYSFSFSSFLFQPHHSSYFYICRLLCLFFNDSLIPSLAHFSRASFSNEAIYKRFWMLYTENKLHIYSNFHSFSGPAIQLRNKANDIVFKASHIPPTSSHRFARQNSQKMNLSFQCYFLAGYLVIDYEWRAIFAIIFFSHVLHLVGTGISSHHVLLSHSKIVNDSESLK